MPRATSAVARNKRKKKVLKAAKGYFGGRKNLYKTAKDAVEKGWEHAYLSGIRSRRLAAATAHSVAAPSNAARRRQQHNRVIAAKSC